MKTAFAVALLFTSFRQETGDHKLPTIPLEEYARRRVALSEKLDKAVIVFEAERLTPGMEGIDANTPRFDFHYLTGAHAAGDILVVMPDGASHLFVAGDAEKLKEKTGIKSVAARETFEAFARESLAGEKKFRTRLRSKALEQLKEAAPDAEFVTLPSQRGNPVSGLRMVKSPAEMAMMKKAADATNKAHLVAMRTCKPDLNEKELQKAIEDTFKKEGCDGLGFPSIVGSGMNGTILHYDTNNQPIPADSLVVCDIGASHRGYVTDITRTLPTGGKYSEEQRAAYQVVLDAQKAAEKLLKPGVTFRELHAAASAVFRERELTKWAYSHSADRTVTHGLSHYVGMAVHDSGTGGIVEGAVITIEPGYYNKDARWGIRIEDIYLVTKDGFERWSSGAPREIEEIEKIMAEARK